MHVEVHTEVCADCKILSLPPRRGTLPAIEQGIGIYGRLYLSYHASPSAQKALPTPSHAAYQGTNISACIPTAWYTMHLHEGPIRPSAAV